tara:strand:- start:14 stop:691 length:678 start_codon:yes stop_codon:yes gene_type:complete
MEKIEMNSHEMINSYGLWGLVIINSLVFIIFAFSFTKPTTARDWRSFGAFSAFIVALFAEMYGFPLTIYFLSGWLSANYPNVDYYSHENGHLWHLLLNLRGDPHFNVIHILSIALVFGGFYLLSISWRVLYAAQKTHQLATTGPYSRIRHPQYVGFFLIMLGFLLQWPTILTLVMFPVLTYMYYRLSKSEEAEVMEEFGQEYVDYAERVPAYIPHFSKQKNAFNE